MRNRKQTFKEKLNKIFKNISKIFKDFNFKIFNLNLPRAITVIGATTGIISLFLPWIISKKDNFSWNSFNSISGNVGYIIVILLLSIIFLTFGSNYKEKMKLYSEIDLKNYVIIIFSGIFMILSGIIIVSFSVGLEIFEKDFKYGNGIVLSIVSSIFIIIGGYLTRKDFYKNSSEIILEKLNQERIKDKKRDNLSLPF